MSAALRVTREVVLTDEKHVGEQLKITWDPAAAENDQLPMVIQSTNTRLRFSVEDVLQLASLILETYGEHDPF